MEKHIYLVRHGQTDSNVDRIYRGREAMLTDEGRRQAERAAERIAAIGVDALISSDLQRAVDTAAIIGTRIGIEPIIDHRFSEWGEPTTLSGKHEDHPESKSLVEKIVNSLPHVRHDDEETYAEFQRRARVALEALDARPEPRVCVVSHGGFLRALLSTVLFGQAPDKQDYYDMFDRVSLSNTGVSYIRKPEDGPWRIVTWNDISHFG